MKCDELKVYHCNEWHNEYTEFYLKYDVDADIDELKASHHKERHEYIKMVVELEEKLKNSRNAHKYWRKEYLIEYKECRHHKNKRCLAMAKECVYGEIKLKRVKMRDMNNHQFWQFDNDYWQKWNNRWLKIAEQFKEAK